VDNEIATSSSLYAFELGKNGFLLKRESIIVEQETSRQRSDIGKDITASLDVMGDADLGIGRIYFYIEASITPDIRLAVSLQAPMNMGRVRLLIAIAMGVFLLSGIYNIIGSREAQTSPAAMGKAVLENTTRADVLPQ